MQKSQQALGRLLAHLEPLIVSIFVTMTQMARESAVTTLLLSLAQTLYQREIKIKIRAMAMIIQMMAAAAIETQQ